MSRPQWPDSINLPSGIPGTIQYEFRAQVAQESPPDQPFPPSEMTKYDFSGFNLVAQGKWGCTGGGSADFSITLVPQPPTP